MSDERKLAAPLHQFVISGFRRVFAAEFELSEFRLTTSDIPDDAFFYSEAGNRVGKFAAFRMDSLSRLRGGEAAAPGSVRGNFTANYGARMQRAVGNSGRHLAVRTRVLPVKFEFTVWYGTTDIENTLGWFSKWIFARENSRLNFELEWMGANYPVESVLSDDSLQVQTRQPLSGEDSGLYVHEGQVETYGWMSHDDPRDTHIVPLIDNSQAELSAKIVAA